jgi:hypothetical protein
MSEQMSPPASVAQPTASGAAHTLPTTYTNYFRASRSAEELILDFGLDPHRRTDDAPEAPMLLQRLVLTWPNARRLAGLLHELLQLHDKAHAPRHPDNPNRPPNTPPPPTPT